MNQVTLIGHVGADAELRAAGSSKKIEFRLATEERWKNQSGEVQKKTTWHRLVMWGDRAEKLSTMVVKGSHVAITGRIDNRPYEKDGEKKYISEIVVDNLEFLGSKPDNAGASSNKPAENASSSGRSSQRASTSKGSTKNAAPPPVDIVDDGDVTDDQIPF